MNIDSYGQNPDKSKMTEKDENLMYPYDQILISP